MKRFSLASLVLLATLTPSLPAQNNVLTLVPPARLAAKKNTVVTAKVGVQLRTGYHVNSNTPSDEYLIPLKLTWTAAPLTVDGIMYPKPKMEKYEFSDKPLSVFTGDFDIVTNFKVPANAPNGLALLVGKLRYQACSHKECLPPKTVEVTVPIDVTH